MPGTLEEPTANGRGYTSRHYDRFSHRAELLVVPPSGLPADARRVTEGVDIEGNKIRIDEDWREPGRAYEVLDLPWTGLTTFRTRDVLWAKEDVESRENTVPPLGVL